MTLPLFPPLFYITVIISAISVAVFMLLLRRGGESLEREVKIEAERSGRPYQPPPPEIWNINPVQISQPVKSKPEAGNPVDVLALWERGEAETQTSERVEERGKDDWSLLLENFLRGTLDRCESEVEMELELPQEAEVFGKKIKTTGRLRIKPPKTEEKPEVEEVV